MTADVSGRIAALGGIASALSRSQPLTRVLEQAADLAREALGAASISISRLEPGTATLRTLLNVGHLGPTETRWPEDEMYSVHDFDIYGMVDSGRHTSINDIDDPACDPHHRGLLVALEKGSSLIAPVVVDGQAWGELYATRRVGDEAFADAHDSGFMEVLVAVLGGAISRATREESLEQLAFRDPLTGLMNRRGLDHQAALAFAVPAGVVRDITVVAVDINGLKHVNDTRGHAVGDQLIVSVGRTLVASFSRLPGSLVSRVGGDEFTVLVSGLDPVRAIEAADELCRQTAAYGEGAGCSAGAATVRLRHGHDVTSSLVFAAADEAQYVAKRNRFGYTIIADSYSPVPALRQHA